MTLHTPLSRRLLFGAAFYDEYRVQGSLDRDLDLMAAAGFTVIRVGESVWSTWEPEPGRFRLEWLLPVLDGSRDRGIDVILGTPTYAIPPWLQQEHPEIAAQTATGVPVSWGWRQEIDYLNADFRSYAERVIRKVIGRYADHPAVIGFQVDNEPGLHLLHNQDAFDGFLGYLRGRYGSVDALNTAWGLTYWSHLLRDWDDLWRPDGNQSPQYALEWRRYQTSIVTDFVGWQADIVREYADASQFVTTCISYERPAVDDERLVRRLDVTAGNPYYKMQDALRIGVEVPRPETWWSSGVWGLFEQGDRMFASAQAPFLVTETNAQSIGQSHWQNHPPYEGQIALAAMALFSRGSRMVEYWQWQTLHSGIETYWGGVLPHSGRPGRIYREVAELGHRLRELEPDFVDFLPDADVALLYSVDTKHSFEGYPPLADPAGGPDERAYLEIFDAFYRGAFEAGAQTRIVHAAQLAGRPVDELVADMPVLVVPTLYVASDAELDLLVAYARAGGDLVLGIRTGYADELARARPEVAPGRLAEAAGITYDEFTTLDAPVSVAGRQPGFDEVYGGRGWADRIVPTSADVLADFASGMYAGLPAVTTNAVGRGRVTYVGTVPDRALARALMGRVVPRPRGADWVRPEAVTVASGTSETGRVWIISNWAPDPAEVVVPRRMRCGGEVVEASASLAIGPWGLLVLVEEGPTG